ncbi:phage tail tape measure protein [Streptomyces olivoreticuli]
MADSFLPPVMVELGGNADGFLKTLTKAIAGLERLAAAAQATAAAADRAFASLDAGAASMAAVDRSAAGATTAMEATARASASVASATEAAAVAADEGMAGIASAAERMATAVDASSTAAGAGLKGLAAGMKVTADESVVAGSAMAASGAKAEGMGAKLLGLGPIFSTVVKWGTLGLAGIGAAAVDLGMHFQTQMTRLATAAGAPIAQVKAMQSQVLATASSVGMSGTKMAEALYHPVSAGLDLKASLQAVKYAAMEAQISGANLDDTTYSLSSVMKAFNMSASDAGPTMAQLNAIVGEGDMRFQDFNASIKNWAPTAAQMGISVTSMGSGLAYLTDRGNSAEVAATRMTMGISMMTTPSAKATKMLVGLGLASTDVKASSDAMQKAMQESGITQNRLAEDLKKPDGLYVALKDLKDGLHNAGVSGTEADSVMSKIFGGGRSDKAVMSLMQNLDGLKSKYDAISHDSTMEHFQAAWDKTTKTLSFQFNQIKTGAENLGIRIGDALLPQVSKFISLLETRGAPVAKGIGAALSGIASGFTGHISKGKGEDSAPSMTGWQKAGQVFRGIAKDLSTFAGQVASSFGNLVRAIGPAAGQIGTVLVGALAGAARLLSTVVGPALKGFTDWLSHNQGLVKVFADVILGGLAIKLTAIGGIKAATSIVGLASKIIGFPMAQVNAIKAAFTGLKTTASGLGKVAGPMVSSFKSGFETVALKSMYAWDAIRGGAGKAAGSVATFGRKVGEVASKVGKAAWSGMIDGAKGLGGALKAAGTAAVDFGKKMLIAAANGLRAAAAWALNRLRLLAQAAAEKLAAAAQWLLNIAMDANPVGLIVIAILALIAIVTYCYTHFAWFRKGVQEAFQAISTAVTTVINFVKAHWQLILIAITGPIGLAVAGVIKYWDQIRSAVSTAITFVINFVKSHWQLLIAILTGPIGIAVLLIVKYWDQITNGFTDAYHAVVSVGKTLVNWVAALPGRLLGALSSLASQLGSSASSAWNSFYSTARSVGSSMLSWVGRIPGQILSGLGSLGDLLASAGRDLVQGLIGGIKSAFGAVRSTLSDLTSLLPSWKGPPARDRVLLHGAGQMIIEGLITGMGSRFDSVHQTATAVAQTTVSAFSEELEIASPSRKFAALGAYVLHGLVNGLTGSTAQVKAATQRIARNLYVDFGSSHQALQRTVAHDNSMLMSLTKQRDSVAARLKDAQKNLSSLWSDWTKARDEASKGIMQNASIIASAPADGSMLSSFDVVQRMRDQVQKTLEFAGNLQQIRAKGLRTDLVQQIANAGVEQGGATAQALASASRGQIAEMNQLQKGMQSAADATGAAVADSMYGAGIKTAQGLVQGLESQQKAIEKQMLKIATSMQGAIKKALGIRSPSQVFADLGQYIPQGLARGISDATHHATTAVHHLAGAVTGAGTGVTGSSGLALAGAGGGRSVIHQHLHLTIEGSVLTERKLRDVLEEQMLRLGARNSQTWQSYKR